MRDNLTQYGHILTSLEQEYAFTQILAYLKSKKIPNNVTTFSLVNTAKLIKILKNHSSRSISALAFPADDWRHENQMCGRDVKRWSAEVLGELEEACSDWAN